VVFYKKAVRSIRDWINKEKRVFHPAGFDMVEIGFYHKMDVVAGLKKRPDSHPVFLLFLIILSV
jgi:hypothetical protein